MIVLAVITTVIHLIGIGGLILWMVAGFPLSIEKFKAWARKQKFPWPRQIE